MKALEAGEAFIYVTMSRLMLRRLAVHTRLFGRFRGWNSRKVICRVLHRLRVLRRVTVARVRIAHRSTMPLRLVRLPARQPLLLAWRR